VKLFVANRQHPEALEIPQSLFLKKYFELKNKRKSPKMNLL